MCVVACEYPYTYKDRNKYMNMETHVALQFQRNRQASESSVERPRDRNGGRAGTRVCMGAWGRYKRSVVSSCMCVHAYEYVCTHVCMHVCV